MYVNLSPTLECHGIVNTTDTDAIPKRNKYCVEQRERIGYECVKQLRKPMRTRIIQQDERGEPNRVRARLGK